MRGNFTRSRCVPHFGGPFTSCTIQTLKSTRRTCVVNVRVGKNYGVMMADNYVGRCMNGPKAGEQLSAPSNSVPVIAPGSDTEGQLVGFYEYKAGGWEWRPEATPDEKERLR
jgi:hypothetical protein